MHTEGFSIFWLKILILEGVCSVNSPIIIKLCLFMNHLKKDQLYMALLRGNTNKYEGYPEWYEQ